MKDIANGIDRQLRSGYGVLYKAAKKSSRAPDLRGSLTIDGIEYWISAWKRDGRLGRDPVAGPYLSLNLTRKEN